MEEGGKDWGRVEEGGREWERVGEGEKECERRSESRQLGKGGEGRAKTERAGMTKGKDRKWKRIKGDHARVLEGRCYWGKSDWRLEAAGLGVERRIRAWEVEFDVRSFITA